MFPISLKKLTISQVVPNEILEAVLDFYFSCLPLSTYKSFLRPLDFIKSLSSCFLPSPGLQPRYLLLWIVETRAKSDPIFPLLVLPPEKPVYTSALSESPSPLVKHVLTYGGAWGEPKQLILLTREPTDASLGTWVDRWGWPAIASLCEPWGTYWERSPAEKKTCNELDLVRWP